MHEEQSSQAGIVRMLAGDLKGVNQFEPAIQNIRGLVQQRELVAKCPDGLSRCRGRPAQAIGRLWSSGNGPEFHQNLDTDEHGFLARKQALYGRLCNGVIGTLSIRQSQEHVGIEKPAHQS